jgi:cobyrinic acid a,c-diamide synthase
VLVLDAAKGARSIAAVVKGFESFDPALHFAGVVLNGVSSQAHYQMLEVAIREVTATPLLGRIPKDSSITIPERYLGLHTAEEQSSGGRRAQLAEIAGRHLDLTPLLELPGSPVSHPSRKHPIVADPGLPTGPGIRIGVARDRAFSFYYEDNFDLLRQNGAEIVFFSPLAEPRLPAHLDALYLGGGYPELHADALSRNVQLGAEIRSFVDSGKPLYAECGGFIYLGSSLTLLDGTVVPMSGVLPLDFEMTSQLVHFGYVEVELVANCLLGAAGTRLRGHSFHCSRFRSRGNLPTAYQVHYSLSGHTEAEGFTYKNVLATYIHLQFRGHPGVTRCLVEAARRMQAVEVRA